MAEPLPVAALRLTLTPRPRRAKARSRDCALRAMPQVAAEAGCVRVTLPLQAPLPSLANARMHWAVKARIVKSQRALVGLVLSRHRAALRALGPRWAVTLTRVSPRALDDDNCAGCLKGCRDQVAAELGVGDDLRAPVTWTYAQRAGQPALELEVRRAPG